MCIYMSKMVLVTFPLTAHVRAGLFSLPSVLQAASNIFEPVLIGGGSLC